MDGNVTLTDNLQEAEQHVNETEGGQAKSGWADSMAKILGSNKPKNKKTLILSRAKKDFEVISLSSFPSNKLYLCLAISLKYFFFRSATR